jgi:hypothetical protein
MDTNGLLKKLIYIDTLKLDTNSHSYIYIFFFFLKKKKSSSIENK